MKLTHFAVAAGLAGLLSLGAANAFARSMSAQEFVTKASVANQFEIESSQLALQKSQSGDVKSFAQMMIDDHTKTGQKLTAVLKSSNSGAQPATELDRKHQKLMDKLNGSDGDKFDRQYISMQTDAHKQAVSLFSDYANHGRNDALRNFASDTLPTLHSHLEHVKQLKGRR